MSRPQGQAGTIDPMNRATVERGHADVYRPTYRVDDGRTAVVGPDAGALGFRGAAVIAPAAPEWIERRHARLAVLVHLARLDRHLRHLNNTHTHIWV